MTCLVQQVVHSAVLLCDAGICHVVAGTPRGTWGWGADGVVPGTSDVVLGKPQQLVSALAFFRLSDFI